jgi:hypothetical protein
MSWRSTTGMLGSALLLCCGFGGTPNCASDEVKETIIKIVGENGPEALLSVAAQGYIREQTRSFEGKEEKARREIPKCDAEKIFHEEFWVPAGKNWGYTQPTQPCGNQCGVNCQYASPKLIQQQADLIRRGGTTGEYAVLADAMRQVSGECQQLASEARKKISLCEEQENKAIADSIARIQKENPVLDLPTLHSKVTYSVKTIRMTDKNETTGAVSCAADLYAVLPNNLGEAKEPITYVIEKLLDEDGYNVTVQGLQ